MLLIVKKYYERLLPVTITLMPDMIVTTTMCLCMMAFAWGGRVWELKPMTLGMLLPIMQSSCKNPLAHTELNASSSAFFSASLFCFASLEAKEALRCEATSF